jgi:SAM-dependent methyltransferase
MPRQTPGPARISAPPCSAEPARFSFACPICRALLDPIGQHEQRCPADGSVYRREDGIWRFLPPERAARFAPFLRDYTTIRNAEGHGSDDRDHYRRLPEVDAADPLAWQWRMRARSFAGLRQALARRGESLRVLDLGAGTGWVSNRLAQLGHDPCAVDLTVDMRDGLGAARHFAPNWPLIQAEFERLPLADAQAEVVIYNASLHYSTDYHRTLREALRVLQRGGCIVIMDSPIYRRDASGRQMVRERQAAFERAYGTRSDALPSIGYLTWDMLPELARDLGLRWRVLRPWYGWRWALRPWWAWLKGQREPSRFALLLAERDP